MRTRLLLYTLTAFVVGFLATPAEAQFAAGSSKKSTQDFHVEVGANWWKATPTLVIRNGGDTATDVDFVDIFGLKDKAFGTFNAILKPGRKHKIRFQYVPMKYDQDSVISRTFTFAERTYTVNTAANAKIDWTLLRLGYEYDFVSNDMGFVGAIVEVKHNHVTTDLTAPAINAASSSDTTAPIPAVGGIGRGYLVPKVLSVTVEVTGFKIPDRDNFQARFLDFDVYGMVDIGRYFSVQGGYRSIDARYLVDNDHGTLKMKGPYIGASARF